MASKRASTASRRLSEHSHGAPGHVHCGLRVAAQAEYAALKDKLDWFKRQIFGRHSEKRLEYDLTEQVATVTAPAVPCARSPACYANNPQLFKYRK